MSGSSRRGFPFNRGRPAGVGKAGASGFAGVGGVSLRDGEFTKGKEEGMQEERLPQLAIAQGLVQAVEEVTDLSNRDKRVLLSRFSEIVRPVCKAVEEAYQRGFDEGAQHQEQYKKKGLKA